MERDLESGEFLKYWKIMGIKFTKEHFESLKGFGSKSADENKKYC
jgi:hypothetical protein